MLRVRRVGSVAVHATTVAAPTVPSDRHGRAVRVLTASKVRAVCGIVLESSPDKPILVLAVAPVSCRACRAVS